ncbi:MAG: hypothetical protein HYY23_16830 [Verrucomicrobia bacterium]|nr:hypothetical protein [Verrucomicrobiota bacterium]
MKRSLRFYWIGLLVAGLEEFITQGVLKKTYGGWIIPTIVAFFPFLALVRLIGWLLGGRLSEAGASLIYYLSAGSIGLLLEWFLMGLSPWKDPYAPFPAMVLFQLGMFSFWGGVAFAPRLLLDRSEAVSRVRKSYLRFLIFGMATIYAVTFAAPPKAQFAASIITVLSTFLGLNFFYFQYIRLLNESGKGEAIAASASRDSSGCLR